jgi:hypothetical protein
MNKRRGQYTTHLHAIRLVEMFEMSKQEDLLWKCPASIGFNPGRKFLFEDKLNLAESPEESPECQVCKTFIGMPTHVEACPCDYFDSTEEAIRLTKIKLKEEGYLD